MITHKIYTHEIDENRSYWECSCGRSGTADSIGIDVVSDWHIPEGHRRVDTNRPLP